MFGLGNKCLPSVTNKKVHYVNGFHFFEEQKINKLFFYLKSFDLVCNDQNCPWKQRNSQCSSLNPGEIVSQNVCMAAVLLLHSEPNEAFEESSKTIPCRVYALGPIKPWITGQIPLMKEIPQMTLLTKLDIGS